MGKLKFIIIIVFIILAGWLGWQSRSCSVKNINCPAPEQNLSNAENSLSVSINSVHQKDGFYNIQVEYPQFAKIGSAFNKKISDLITNKIENFKKDAKDNYEARGATAPSESPLPENPEQPFDFISTWEPVQLNNNYVSFVTRLYYFTGGAHGITEVYAFNYDLKKDKEITLLDFLNSSQPAVEKLADLAKKDIAFQLEASGVPSDSFLQQMVEDGTKPTLDNYQNFSFSYDSLTIYFQQYQVAPGAMGPMTSVFYKGTLDENSINSDYLK